MKADNFGNVADDFWDFVESDTWLSCSSLRVTEGALLDRLIHTLIQLEEDGDVITYDTVYYDDVIRPVPISCIRNRANDEVRRNCIWVT